MKSTPEKKIFIQPVNNNFDEHLRFAVANKFNLEIATFAFADVLDNNWKTLVKDYRKKLKDFRGIISMHGAFQDLILCSRDKKVRVNAEKRIIHNLEIAKTLNAEYIVFHANYNPLIRNESYKVNWLNRNAEFWCKMLDKYNIHILIENLWEPSPLILKSLLDKVNSSLLKICFDTGHANVFSEVPAGEWFRILGSSIAYIHVNDNKGDADSELVPGKGNINWNKFNGQIIKHKMNPFIVFEVNSLKNSISSFRYFKKHKIYPFVS